MKNLSGILTALVLALLIACTLPAQVFADSLPEYISEVKVYQGSYKDAEAEGFTILKGSDGKPVDLNQGSGATGIGAKGNKKVYLGYKTTTDRDEAITDLALMNMKGGYSVQEYEILMAEQMSKQIVPFVESFLAAIIEYRENYKSGNAENKQRAQFIHDVLNKLTDDDTGGAKLGDLLLNETVYEMAKPKHDALSDSQKENTSFYEINNQVLDSIPEAEKNKHADILTIVAQSNGKITLVMQNLLTRGADTGDESWLDRFAGMTYENLEEDTGMTPTDAKAELTLQYEDDAKRILSKWDDFREQLLDYEDNVETVEEFDEEKAEQINEDLENINENSDPEDAAETIVDYAKQQLTNAELINCVQNAAIHDILDEIDYLDGTMLDFFSKTSAEIEEDITLLYPLVASLSEGQRAGLDFLSMLDLFNVALTTAEGYKNIDLSKIEEASIYADVDRGIYQKGGVALTSDALRSDALAKVSEQSEDSFFGLFSTSTLVMMAITGVAAIGTFASLMTYTAMKLDVYTVNRIAKCFEQVYEKGGAREFQAKFEPLLNGQPEMNKALKIALRKGTSVDDAAADYAKTYSENMAPKTNVAGYLAAGFAIAMVALVAVTTYLSYRDMKAHYKVDFTPIPKYMVEETDIVAYNENGDRVVLKNQSAYYKAVECNRKDGDAFFDDIGICADMNGAVNPQWLALYSVKKEGMAPILADSLKVVVGSTDIPAGYKTGIHMFGEDTAFNLNHPLYCWNQGAKSVFVYFKVDTSAPKTASAAGSNFSGGSLALAGVGGLAAGAVISGIAASLVGKKKSKKEAA